MSLVAPPDGAIHPFLFRQSIGYLVADRLDETTIGLAGQHRPYTSDLLVPTVWHAAVVAVAI